MIELRHNSMIWLPWLPKLRLRDPVVAGCLQVCLLQYQQSVGSFGQTQRAVWQERWSTAIAVRWAFSDLKCFQSKRLLKTYKRNAEEPRLKTLQIMFRSNLVVVPWVLRIAAIYVYMVSRGDKCSAKNVFFYLQFVLKFARKRDGKVVRGQAQVMKNDKTVDPRDKKSTKVIQLETAMGAAISCFEGARVMAWSISCWKTWGHRRHPAPEMSPFFQFQHHFLTVIFVVVPSHLTL